MDEFLTVAAVARRLGVAPATLRTWDRRYGLGPSLHEAGNHRRYCAKDLAKLTMMRRLISAGVAPAQAAQRALSHEGEMSLAKIISHCTNALEAIDAMYSATSALDQVLLRTMLAHEILDHGIVVAWEEVFVPVLQRIDSHCKEKSGSAEVEHIFFTQILKGVIHENTSEITAPLNAHPILLASVGDELHCLALHALSAALAERSVSSFFLGPRTPLSVLQIMVERSAPPAIFLWAQASVGADPKFLREIPAIRPAPRIVLGGPGWDREERLGAIFAEDLEFACEEMARAVGAAINL